MTKKIVVVPGLTPEWLRKKNNIMKAVDERLVHGLEKPGKGLTLDQLQARAVEDRCDGCKCICNPFLKKAEVLVPVPLKYDKTKDGWTLLENVPFDGQPFEFGLVEFLRSGESSVNGEVMKLRAKELNAHLGQGHAEYLLENQHKIPVECRGKFLVFPGTVWQDSDGRRGVPCLSWDGDGWFLRFAWLWRGCRSVDRLVCLRKPACR